MCQKKYLQKKLIAHHLHCQRQQKTIFQDLSFEIDAGEILLIQGVNGVGKSSLLRLLCGLSTANKGEITWGEQCITHLGATYRNALHYLGHVNGLRLELSVAENIILAANILQIPLPDFNTILDKFSLTEFKHLPLRYLSAGQKRRVALIKLLLFPKPIWILDEPFTGLDTSIQASFLSLLQDHLKLNGICILSSHHAIKIANAKILRLKTC